MTLSLRLILGFCLSLARTDAEAMVTASGCCTYSATCCAGGVCASASGTGCGTMVFGSCAEARSFNCLSALTSGSVPAGCTVSGSSLGNFSCVDPSGNTGSVNNLGSGLGQVNVSDPNSPLLSSHDVDRTKQLIQRQKERQEAFYKNGRPLIGEELKKYMEGRDSRAKARPVYSSYRHQTPISHGYQGCFSGRLRARIVPGVWRSELGFATEPAQRSRTHEVDAGSSIDASGARPIGGVGAHPGEPDKLPLPTPERPDSEGGCRDERWVLKADGKCYFRPSDPAERRKFGLPTAGEDAKSARAPFPEEEAGRSGDPSGDRSIGGIGVHQGEPDKLPPPNPERPDRKRGCRDERWVLKADGMCYFRPKSRGISAASRRSAARASAASAKLPPRDAARGLFQDRSYAEAASVLSPLARKSSNPGLVGEYAYALALAGFKDAALAQLDRAYALDWENPEVLYYASSALGALGLPEAAEELSRPEPAWLAGETVQSPKTESRPVRKDPTPDLQEAQTLLESERYLAAAVRFGEITRKRPEEALGWAGYAVALEKIGAYRAAAAAAREDLRLSGSDLDEATQSLMEAHARELEERPPLESRSTARKANEFLQGRYLAFLGGNFNHDENESTLSLNGRLGRFFTNHLDAGLSLGFVAGHDNSDFNGASFGVSTRYHKPLPTRMPLNAVLGARMEYAPGPEDNFAFVPTPGFSYVLDSGSIDLFLDIALSGPLKDTKTLSLGYTLYFGGVRR